MDSINNFLTKVMFLLLAILSPIYAVMATVGILIFVDLATGIWAAIKRKEAISSAALRRTISKMVIYQTAIISGFLLEKFIMGDTFPVTKIVAGFIGMVEFKSILENGNLILGVDMFKALIQKLGSSNDDIPKQ